MKMKKDVTIFRFLRSSCWLIQVFKSTTFLLPLFFTISIVILVSSCLITFTILGNYNINRLFYEKEGLILSNSEQFTTSFLSNPVEKTEMFHNFLEARGNHDNWDFNFFENSTESIDQIQQLYKFMYSLVAFDKHGDKFTVAFGNMDGVVYILDTEFRMLFKRNMTNSYPECTVDNPIGKCTVDVPKGEMYATPIYHDLSSNQVDPAGEKWFLFIPDYYDYRVSKGSKWFRTGVVGGEEITWVNFVRVTNDLYSSFQRTLYKSNGDAAGVLGIGISFVSFHKFMDSFSDLDGDLYMISKNDGKVVASTLKEFVLIEKNGMLVHILPQESNNEMIRSTSAYLDSVYGDIKTIDSISPPIAMGYQYLISGVSVNITGNSFLFVCVQSQYSVYMGIILANVISITLSVVFSFLCLVFIVVTFFLLSSLPLINLVKQLKKVNKMELDNVKITRSWIFEIGLLQRGFKDTISKLRQYRSFLPSTLISNVMEDDNDRDSDGSKNSSKSGCSYGSDEGSERVSDITSVKTTFFNRFDTGLIRKESYLIVLMFSGIQDILSKGFSELYVKCFSDCCDVITRICKRGKLTSYGMEKFVVTYASPGLCINNAFEVFEKIKIILKSKKEFKNMGCKMILDNGNFFCGVIGSDTLKTHSFLLEERMPYYKKVFKKGKNFSLVINKTFQDLVDEKTKYVAKCFDVIRMENRTSCLYYLENIIKLRDDEWMYELELTKKAEKFIPINESIQELCDEKDFDECVLCENQAKLEEQKIDDRDVKRLITMCEVLKDEKRTIGSYLEKTKEFTSVVDVILKSKLKVSKESIVVVV